MTLKFWQWRHDRQVRLRGAFIAQQASYTMSLTQALTDALRHTTIGVKQDVHVTHAQRPPAPRPTQLTVSFKMSDGFDYKLFIPLNGQAYWHESMPQYVKAKINDVSEIAFYMSYADGGMI